MKFKPDDCTLDFRGTIKISRGENTLPYLSLITVDSFWHYLICHEKGALPNKEDLLQSEGTIKGNKGTWELICENEEDAILSAFSHYKECRGGLVPFSFLVGACAVQGVDLFDYVD